MEQGQGQYIKVKGTLRRIFFPKNSTKVRSGEYAIIVFDISEVLEGEPNYSKYGNITLKGVVPQITYQDEYIVQAKKISKDGDGSYEIIFMRLNYNITDPIDQKIFLSRILTETQVNLLYTTIDNPFEAIKQEDIPLLTSIKGIGEATALSMIQRYKDSIDNSYAIVQLDALGLTNRMIDKLIQEYGSPDILVDKIKDNPYILCDEVRGIGWKKADEMALNYGIARNDIRRINAYIQYFLSEEMKTGNSWVAANILYDRLCENVGEDLSNQDFKNSMWDLHSRRIITWTKDRSRVALVSSYELEKNIAQELMRLQNAESIINKSNIKDVKSTIKEIEEKQGWEFTDEQLEAIDMALEQNVAIINGGAGCVDAETEFFDGNTWKRIDEYEQGDNVLQYQKNGKARVVRPLAYIKKPVDKLYHLRSPRGDVDQVLSLDHRVVYKLPNTKKLAIDTFDNIRQTHLNNKQGFGGRFINTFISPKSRLIRYKVYQYSDLEVRLGAAILIAGNYRPDFTPRECNITANNKKEREHIEKLLDDLGIEYLKDYVHNWTSKKTGKRTHSHVYTFYANYWRKITTKHFYDIWLHANPHQSKLMMDEMLFWLENDQEANKDKFVRTFINKEKFRVDTIQYICAANGFRATIDTKILNKHRKWNRRRINHFLTIYKNKPTTGLRVGDANSKTVNAMIQEFIPADGMQYCFTVPSGMLVLRRNGRIFVTGNCGKSSAVGAILEILSNYSSAVCALSGRAASRIAELSNKKGYTIHRLLKYIPGMRAEHDANKPLHHHIIVVDECSMIGGSLFYKLLQAIQSGSKLIFLGDTGQLPSIGSMNLLEDMLRSNVIPKKQLIKIHRQAAASGIITESVRIREQTMPYSSGWTGTEVRGQLQDLVLDIYDDKLYTSNRIMHHYKEQLKKYKINDIAIAVPMRTKGESSTLELNKQVQAYINPSVSWEENEIIDINTFINDTKVHYSLRPKDRVIVKRNNYTTRNLDGKTEPIYNGNLGTITKIDLQNDLLVIKFDEQGQIKVSKDLWSTIELGYAITTHSLQGSQAPCVIVGLDYDAFKLLSKEWIYTAITRAQKYCIVCAESKALRTAVATSDIPNKQTFLDRLLNGTIEEYDMVEIVEEDN